MSPAVFGKTPVESDVDRTPPMARCEHFGRLTADHDGTVGLIAQREVKVEARGVPAAVEQLAVAAVWICGKGQVGGAMD